MVLVDLKEFMLISMIAPWAKWIQHELIHDLPGLWGGHSSSVAWQFGDGDGMGWSSQRRKPAGKECSPERSVQPNKIGILTLRSLYWGRLWRLIAESMGWRKVFEAVMGLQDGFSWISDSWFWKIFGFPGLVAKLLHLEASFLSVDLAKHLCTLTSFMLCNTHPGRKDSVKVHEKSLQDI